MKSTRLSLLSGLLLVAPLLIAADDPERPTANPGRSEQSEPNGRIRLGAIGVNGFYTYRAGPCFVGHPYGYWGYAAHSAYRCGFYPPLYHPNYYLGFPQGVAKGKVKLRIQPSDAEIFLDRGYAGTAKDLKTFWLRPGAYNLTVRHENHAGFQKRIYVLTGKTLRINARLAPEAKEVEK